MQKTWQAFSDADRTVILDQQQRAIWLALHIHHVAFFGALLREQRGAFDERTRRHASSITLDLTAADVARNSAVLCPTQGTRAAGEAT